MESAHDYIDALPDRIKNHVSIMLKTPEIPYLLHGSIDGNIKQFIPRTKFRTNDIKEDKSIERICCSPYVLGCFEAMDELQNYLVRGIFDGISEIKQQEMLKTYQGGWYIYALDYEWCLKPDDTLVFDANVTDECWLVNQGRKNHSVEILGKMMIKELSYTNRGSVDGHPAKVTFLLEVLNKSLLISPNEKALTRGLLRNHLSKT